VLKTIPAFWDMMPCRLVHRYQRIGGSFFLRLQGSPRRANVDAYTSIYTLSSDNILLLLLIAQSFDWLAAFHLDLLQAILSIAV